VRALRRAGRQTEAIRAAGAARDALAGIGLEPGSALRQAEREVYAEPDEHDRVVEHPIAYASGGRGHVAYTVVSDGPDGQRDLVVLNPGMITIDGLLDEPHARSALARLGEHARVICFDRRGIGLSDPLDPRSQPLDEWVDDVAQLYDALQLRVVHLLANFDTGLVAIEFAARYPERVASLILVQCYPRYSRAPDYAHGLDPATTVHLIKDAVDPATPADRIDTAVLVAPSVGGEPAFRSWWTRIGQRAAGPETATTIRTLATTADVRDRLGAITAPTLVVHRRNCLNVDIGHAHYLAEHIHGAQLEITPGTDSLWFTDTPDVLDRAISFLGQLNR
jgi:pimeloyl-ACP methyl ester carboxylesterase